MKIYTKTGDNGTTQIIGGKRVSKCDSRVMAYGTLDELNSLIGVIVSLLEGQLEIQTELEQIQHMLFDCGIDLATVEGLYPYKTNEEHVNWLEGKIDAYTEILPPIKKFILPGGTTCALYLHLARTTARRAEREIVALMEEEGINQEVVQYVNRLSDYLFVLARVVNFREGKDDVFYDNGAAVFKKV